jgi:hypothetical protein
MIGVISRWAPVSSDPPGVVTAVKAAMKATGKSAVAGGPPVTKPPLDVQQLIDLGQVISNIRERPPLNKSQRTAAARTLATIPPQLMELLEPVTPLQAMCQQLILAIIEFSKLDPTQNAKRRTIFLDQIAALQAWVAQPGIRDAIVNNPITC